MMKKKLDKKQLQKIMEKKLDNFYMRELGTKSVLTKKKMKKNYM